MLKLLGLSLLLLMTPLRAEQDDIQGFIVDSTISRIGHEFYRHFSDRLRDTSTLDFNLVVRERPSVGWGSLVWVELGQHTLYRSFLQPNTAQLKDTAYQAADQVLEQIARQKLENLMYDSFDLDRDEI
ncbi:MAG: curli production assembly/transport protein CsgE [Pseudomonas sp.]